MDTQIETAIPAASEADSTSIELTLVTPSAELSLAGVKERARAYIAHSKAENTLRAYDSDWRHFATWCAAHGAASLPASPETVALYLADIAGAGMKAATLGRRLAAIAKRHQAGNYDSPAAMKHAVVKETLAGIRRQEGTAQKGKEPLLTDQIRQLVRAVPASLLGTRDHALLLLGFSGAFRRSELVALNVEDVHFCDDGARVTLRRSKTDQEGVGRAVAVPWGSNPDLCPIRSLRAWLNAAHITDGPLFRCVDRHGRIGSRALTAQVVATVVKRYCAVSGLDAAAFAAHSLRAGMATQAAINGASERSIMRQTGHRSLAMVRRYIRDSDLFRDNAAARLGL